MLAYPPKLEPTYLMISDLTSILKYFTWFLSATTKKYPALVTNAKTWTHISKMLPVDVLTPPESRQAVGMPPLAAAGSLK